MTYIRTIIQDVVHSTDHWVSNKTTTAVNIILSFSTILYVLSYSDTPYHISRPPFARWSMGAISAYDWQLTHLATNFLDVFWKSDLHLWLLFIVVCRQVPENPYLVWSMDIHMILDEDTIIRKGVLTFFDRTGCLERGMIDGFQFPFLRIRGLLLFVSTCGDANSTYHYHIRFGSIRLS